MGAPGRVERGAAVPWVRRAPQIVHQLGGGKHLGEDRSVGRLRRCPSRSGRDLRPQRSVLSAEQARPPPRRARCGCSRPCLRSRSGGCPCDVDCVTRHCSRAVSLTRASETNDGPVRFRRDDGGEPPKGSDLDAAPLVLAYPRLETRTRRAVNRGDRTRTCNPRFWRPVRYQLRHAPGLRGRLYRRPPWAQ